MIWPDGTAAVVLVVVVLVVVLVVFSASLSDLARVSQTKKRRRERAITRKKFVFMSHSVCLPSLHCSANQLTYTFSKNSNDTIFLLLTSNCTERTSSAELNVRQSQLKWKNIKCQGRYMVVNCTSVFCSQFKVFDCEHYSTSLKG